MKFCIRKSGQYWTGKGWSNDLTKAIAYDHAANAIANFPATEADYCAAVGLSSHQEDQIA